MSPVHTLAYIKLSSSLLISILLSTHSHHFIVSYLPQLVSLHWRTYVGGYIHISIGPRVHVSLEDKGNHSIRNLAYVHDKYYAVYSKYKLETPVV